MKTITRKEFETLYEIHTVTELAKMLDVSRPTIRKWVVKFGLPGKRRKLIK